MRQLDRLSGIDAGNGKRIKLLLIGFATAVNEPLAILTEGESRDAFFRIRDLARLAAIGAHDVDLVLARATATRSRASRARHGWRISIR